MLWDRWLPLASIWRRLVSAGVWCPHNHLLYVQEENEAREELRGGKRGRLGVDMKKEFLVCFYGKASVNVSRLPAHRSGPPRLTDSSGFHQEEETRMSAHRRTQRTPDSNKQSTAKMWMCRVCLVIPDTRAHRAWEQSNRRTAETV